MAIYASAAIAESLSRGMGGGGGGGGGGFGRLTNSFLFYENIFFLVYVFLCVFFSGELSLSDDSTLGYFKILY